MKIHPEIRGTLAMFADGDVYGWAMGGLWGVTDVLYATEGDIPESWQVDYKGHSRQEMLTDLRQAVIHVGEYEGDAQPEACELFYGATQLAFTHDDLRDAGEVLIRYLRFVERAGLDY